MGTQDTGSFFAVLALQDYYGGNTSWLTTGTETLKLYHSKYGLTGTRAINSDLVYWGLTFFYSYRTYNDTALLELTEEAYNATYAGFITPSSAASGQGVGRGNVSFLPPTTNCAGSALLHTYRLTVLLTLFTGYAGGVFTVGIVL